MPLLQGSIPITSWMLAKYRDSPTLDLSVVIPDISAHYPDEVQTALAQNNCDSPDTVLSTLQIYDQSIKSKQTVKFSRVPIKFNKLSWLLLMFQGTMWIDTEIRS